MFVGFVQDNKTSLNSNKTGLFMDDQSLLLCCINHSLQKYHSGLGVQWLTQLWNSILRNALTGKRQKYLWDVIDHTSHTEQKIYCIFKQFKFWIETVKTFQQQ